MAKNAKNSKSAKNSAKGAKAKKPAAKNGGLKAMVKKLLTPKAAAKAPAKAVNKAAGKGESKAGAKTAAPVPAKAKPEMLTAKGKVAAPVDPANTANGNGEEAAGDEDVVLTDAEGRRYCRVSDCDQLAVVDTYCRFHYLLFWKKIQVRKKILSEGKLEKYIEDLTARYPDKYLEMLRKDLRSEKEFLAAIQELELDDRSEETEFEDDNSFIDEIRDVSSEPAAREDDEF